MSTSLLDRGSAVTPAGCCPVAQLGLAEAYTYTLYMGPLCGSPIRAIYRRARGPLVAKAQKWLHIFLYIFYIVKWGRAGRGR